MASFAVQLQCPFTCKKLLQYSVGQLQQENYYIVLVVSFCDPIVYIGHAPYAGLAYHLWLHGKVQLCDCAPFFAL